MTTLFDILEKHKVKTYTTPSVPTPPQEIPGVVLLDPYMPPAGTTDAQSIYEIFEIVPSNSIIPTVRHVYDVGIEPLYKLEFDIRNLAVNYSIDLGIAVPSFLSVSTALGVTISNISPQTTLEVENGSAVISIGPRQYRKVIITISELDCLNLIRQGFTDITESLIFYVDVPDLTGPVHVRAWTTREGIDSVIDFTGGETV